MLRNSKGDAAILFSLGVSVVILGFIVVLQIIASNKLRLNISSIQSLESFSPNEVRAWHGYMKKKAIDDGTFTAQKGSVQTVVNVGGTVVVEGAATFFCGSAGGSAELCITKSKAAGGGAGGGGGGGTGTIDPPDPVGSWISLTKNPASPFGTFGSVFWTGTHVLVWGGISENGREINTGGLFDLKSNTWTEISQTNAPSPRYQHGSVWTGKKLVVWGGFNQRDQKSLSDGGQYDPATKTWTPISKSPLAYYQEGYSGSRVAWTGSQMIFINYGAHPGDKIIGATYTPATDSWTSIPEAPKMPYSFGVEGNYIWTGKELIVWGGFDYDPTKPQSEQFYKTSYGALYDPSNNTWRLMSTLNAPAPRERYTAVWTGKEMILWGGGIGQYGANEVNSGARYNPTTDTWTPTSSEHAPLRRALHTAVWTGQEMIIWGGTSGSNTTTSKLLDTGAVYDPAKDSWTPLTVEAATPSPRAWSGAVWTGSKMVVVGGYQINDGAILDLGVRTNAKANTPTLSLSKSIVTPGQYFNVHFDQINLPLIASFALGASADQGYDPHQSYNKTGDFTLVAPSVPGEYEVRAYPSQGEDLKPIKVTLKVEGGQAACGVGAPTNIEAAKLNDVQLKSVIQMPNFTTWGLTDAAGNPIRKEYNSAMASEVAGGTSASDVKIKCTGDTSELDFEPLKGNLIGKEYLFFNGYFAPKTKGTKSSSCELTYCDGVKTQKFNFNLNGTAN